jgi:hypothetical protein
MEGKPLPPNLVAARDAIQRLLDSGVPRHAVHDVYIGSSLEAANLWSRGAYEWSCAAQTVTEGRVTFRNGEGSSTSRRSVSGYREFLERREAVAR